MSRSCHQQSQSSQAGYEGLNGAFEPMRSEELFLKLSIIVFTIVIIISSFKTLRPRPHISVLFEKGYFFLCFLRFFFFFASTALRVLIGFAHPRENAMTTKNGHAPIKACIFTSIQNHGVIVFKTPCFRPKQRFQKSPLWRAFF